MLQHNLIYGIQQKIKENKETTLGNNGIIEESEVIEISEKTTEPILESSFIAGIYDMTHKHAKKTQNKKTLITESREKIK